MTDELIAESFQAEGDGHVAEKTDILRTDEVGKPSDKPTQGENGDQSA